MYVHMYMDRIKVAFSDFSHYLLLERKHLSSKQVRCYVRQNVYRRYGRWQDDQIGKFVTLGRVFNFGSLLVNFTFFEPTSFHRNG
jgi:hypothetical protein